MAKKRIGILTSGGDCPGLNATIRGIAKACYEKMGVDNVQIVGIQNGYYGLINNIAREMQPSEFSGILTQGGTILGTKRQPFKMISSIGEDNIDKVKLMKETYKKQKLDCLLTLGGNGTHNANHIRHISENAGDVAKETAIRRVVRPVTDFTLINMV